MTETEMMPARPPVNDLELRLEILTKTLESLSENPVAETLRGILDARLGPAESSVKEALYRSLHSEIEGYGPLDPYLADPEVTEILINSSREIFIEREGTLARAGAGFASEITYERFIKRLLYEMDRAADRRHPFADGTLSDGSRVHVALPPVTKGPVISIRRHTFSHWKLDQLIEKKALTSAEADYLRGHLVQKSNILICGATGSGKTTLLRALLAELQPHERVITVEDTEEIGLSSERGVALLTRPSPDKVAPPISLQDLIRNALRMRPDRIIVGEMRGEEALVFLDAASTGHQGCLSSIHGSSATEALSRLEGLVSRAVPHWSLAGIRQLVFNAVDVVVCMGRKNGARSVREISELTALENFGYLIDQKFG